jgi:thiosulfate dehydrogenase (quinone) large subunit
MPRKKKTVNDKTPYAWAALRISIGLVFLWAFLDKLIGLGFTTCRDPQTNSVELLCGKSWLEGGSPTTGFLKFGTQGPFAEFYQSLAGNGFIDLLFMAGLLGIGLALVAGVGVKIAAVSGSLLLVMMWTAVLPPEHHPFLDDHIIYTIALIGVLLANDKQVWGLRSWWVRQRIVKQYPVLE